MPTTTQIATVDYRVPAEYYAEFVGDYDTDAVDTDVLSELNTLVPEGVTVAANGMVFAGIDVADAAREIDWAELLETIDVETIAQRHDRTRV